MKSLIICSLITLFSSGIKAQEIPKWEADIVSEKKYTYKAVEACDKKFNYGKDTVGYYIGLKVLPLASDTIRIFNPMYEPCTYYWNKIFDCYTNEDKIRIIEELLEYVYDADLSGKKVRFYGRGKDTKIPETISYTLQTEALYIITLLSMSNYAPYYCPYPVLINNKTGKEINNNSKELKRVYGVYREWVKKNKKTGFKDFYPPLYKSNYSWYATDEKIKDVMVSEFTLSGMIIGK